MEILNGFEPCFPPETVKDRMLLADEFGCDGLIASLTQQRDVPRRQQNVRVITRIRQDHQRHNIRSAFRLICDSLGVMQREMSIIADAFAGKPERIRSEPAQITRKVKSPHMKSQSDEVKCSAGSGTMVHSIPFEGI
jgi:hypothetical protein